MYQCTQVNAPKSNKFTVGNYYAEDNNGNLIDDEGNASHPASHYQVSVHFIPVI